MAETKPDTVVFLKYKEAVAMLPKGRVIHVFLNGPGMLLGADWSRKSVLVMLAKGERQLGGEQCTKMGHGLVCKFQDRYHFVKTKEIAAA